MEKLKLKVNVGCVVDLTDENGNVVKAGFDGIEKAEKWAKENGREISDTVPEWLQLWLKLYTGMS